MIPTKQIIAGLIIIMVTSISFTAIAEAAEENPKSLQAKKVVPTERAPDFIKGAQLWASNCGRCHNLREPKDYNDELWKATAFHMRVRAGLTGQETRDILEYLKNSN